MILMERYNHSQCTLGFPNIGFIDGSFEIRNLQIMNQYYLVVNFNASLVVSVAFLLLTIGFVCVVLCLELSF